LAKLAKEAGATLPDTSIAALLEQINLKQMADDGVVYRFGEVDAHNTTMMRQLNENNANMGTGHDSAVLQMENIPIDTIASAMTPVKVIPIMRRGIRDENNFFVRWGDGLSDYRLIVSRGHATTKGRLSPRVDIRTWHNGRLPEQHILESVLASALIAIKHEVEIERKWGKPRAPEFPTPSIPLYATSQILCRTMFPDAGNEIIIPVDLRPRTFDPPMPETHISVEGDENTIAALEAIGATERVFGDKRMIPGRNKLQGNIGLIT